MPRLRQLGSDLFGLVLHVPIAMLGGPILAITAASALALVLLAMRLRPATFNALYTPFSLGAVVFFGFLVNRWTRHLSACWVGAAGLVYLLVVAFWDLSLYEHSPYYRALTGGHFIRYEFDKLFAPKCGTVWGGSECRLEQLLVTLPMATSMAYSVGAWLGLRSGRGEASSSRKSNTTEPA